jgi:hypothetical protein
LGLKSLTGEEAERAVSFQNMSKREREIQQSPKQELRRSVNPRSARNLGEKKTRRALDSREPRERERCFEL